MWTGLPSVSPPCTRAPCSTSRVPSRSSRRSSYLPRCAAEEWGARSSPRPLHRADAPLFYEALGFEHTGRRYVRRFD